MKKLSIALFLLVAVSAAPVVAQNVRVHVGRRATAIPQACVGVNPVLLEGDQIDIRALVKEAFCKGSGDMLADYTYSMSYARRERGDKGQFKVRTTTYEVYMPTLKGGTNARGVLLVTTRDGVPVPPAELEKERLRAGERLQKEEDKVAREPDPPAETNEARAKGMMPLGMYPRTGIDNASFGIKRGGAVFDAHTFLRACEFKFLRREQTGGRETLVFAFRPSADAQLEDDERYIAMLSGNVWIDAADRIVARLEGWPAVNAGALAPRVPTATLPAAATPLADRPPAVLLEMTRLPDGVWLPATMRIDGVDYPGLFDHVNFEVLFHYGEYKRFNTETKDIKLDPPKPR